MYILFGDVFEVAIYYLIQFQRQLYLPYRIDCACLLLGLDKGHLISLYSMFSFILYIILAPFMYQLQLLYSAAHCDQVVRAIVEFLLVVKECAFFLLYRAYMLHSFRRIYRLQLSGFRVFCVCRCLFRGAPPSYLALEIASVSFLCQLVSFAGSNYISYAFRGDCCILIIIASLIISAHIPYFRILYNASFQSRSLVFIWIP